MKNWTIGKRITIGFVIVVALSAGMGITAWISMHGIGKHADEVSNDSVPGLAASGDIMLNLGRAHLALIRHVLTTNANEKQTYEAQMKEIATANAKLVDDLGRFCNSPEEKQLSEKMKQAREDYVNARGPVLQFSDASKNQEAMAQLEGPVRAAYEVYDQLGTQFNQLEVKTATDAANTIQHSAKFSKFMLSLVVVGELAISSLLNKGGGSSPTTFHG